MTMLIKKKNKQTYIFPFLMVVQVESKSCMMLQRGPINLIFYKGYIWYKQSRGNCFHKSLLDTLMFMMLCDACKLLNNCMVPLLYISNYAFTNLSDFFFPQTPGLKVSFIRDTESLGTAFTLLFFGETRVPTEKN